MEKIDALEWLNAKPATIPYEDALSIMEQRVADIHQNKAAPAVWLLEHEPIYTAGTSAKADDLLNNNGFPVYQTGRGGQFTYHGPGQRIAYVMLNLKQPSVFNKTPDIAPDIRGYVTFLESWLIATLKHFGLEGRTYRERVGVWVDDGKGSEAKIAAIGIRVRHWVTYHGIALNVQPNLAHFQGIVPCGIRHLGVTSLHDLGIKASMEEVDAVLKTEFHRLYEGK